MAARDQPLVDWEAPARRGTVEKPLNLTPLPVNEMVAPDRPDTKSPASVEKRTPLLVNRHVTPTAVGAAKGLAASPAMKGTTARALV